MSKRPRRNHSPLFKAKVAVDAIKVQRQDAYVRSSPFSPISLGIVLGSVLRALTRFDQSLCYVLGRWGGHALGAAA
jgi:hypothetical protein